MVSSNVVTFIENAGTSMTVDEGFAFVKRSRRQVDRIVANADANGMCVNQESEAKIRAGLDELEAKLLTLI